MAELPRNLSNIINSAVEESRITNEASNKYTLDKAVATTSAYFGTETKKAVDTLSMTINDSFLTKSVGLISSEITLSKLLGTVSEQVVPLLERLQKRKYEKKAKNEFITPEIIKAVDGLIKSSIMPLTKEDDELVKAIEAGNFNAAQSRLMMEKFFTVMSQQMLRQGAEDDPNKVAGQTPQAVKDKNGNPVEKPSKNQAKEGIGILTGIGSFFGTIAGGAFRGVLKPLLALGTGALMMPFRLLGTALSTIGATVARVSSLLLGKNITGFLGNIITFGGRFGRFAGGIGAILASAAIADLFNSPERVQRYLDIFSKLWNEHIIPMFNYINERIFKPIIEAFSGLLGEGGAEGAFNNFGKWINETLLFFFETILPPLLNGIGYALSLVVDVIAHVLKPAIEGIVKIISSFVDYIKAQVEVFRQLLNGEISFGDFLTQFVNNVWTLFKSWLNAITQFVIDLFALDKLADMSKDVLIIAKDFGVSILTAIVDAIISVVKSGLDLGGMIKDKIVSVFQAIADQIPSASDIGNMFYDSTIGKIGNLWGGEETPVTQSADVRPVESQAYRNAADMKPPAANVVVINSATTNNTSNNTSNVSSGGGKAAAKGIASTAAPMSVFDTKLYGFVNSM